MSHLPGNYLNAGYGEFEIPSEIQSLFDDGTYGLRQGKVRDIIEADDQLLLVTTDRVSAFDVVMPSLIPGRGEILTRLSNFWFNFFPQIPNHLCGLTVDHNARIRTLQSHMIGMDFSRVQVCVKAKPLPIEFVVRGYITGSAWHEYQTQNQKVNDTFLPSGLKQCDELEEPLFTPATKAEEGQHDENISVERSVDICAMHLGWPRAAAEQLIKALAQRCIEMYSHARSYALTRGIIIADTKFEFGVRDNTILLIDEVLTPDSSRFWPLSEYEPGRDQNSYDKQILRNYLQELVNAGKWDKQSKPECLPDEIVLRIKKRYTELFHRLTGIMV